MTHAIVLIEAERDAMATLGGALADIEGVGAAYSVTGEWDFVALVHLARHEQLAEVVTRGRSPRCRASCKTQTMVAFEAFSRHDLESLFSIGVLSPARRDAAATASSSARAARPASAKPRASAPSEPGAGSAARGGSVNQTV